MSDQAERMARFLRSALRTQDDWREPQEQTEILDRTRSKETMKRIEARWEAALATRGVAKTIAGLSLAAHLVSPQPKRAVRPIPFERLGGKG